MPQIKAILDCINSETDQSGNRYWAFRYTDCESGKQVCGNISGGESNISAILRYMPGTHKEGFTDWDSVYYTRHEMKKREFRKLTADWPYAGCRPEDELVPFILKALGKPAFIFDERSAIRERLFLLSVLKDPNDSANWAYDPRRDRWAHAGGDELAVEYEGSRSLELLAARGIERKQAMEMIGYPEA